MNFKFSGINIQSDRPADTFAFYMKLGFRALEECAPDDKWYGAEFALQDDSDEPKIWIWRRQPGDDMVVQNLFVFRSGEKEDRLDELYTQFTQAGVSCPKPETAVWGGREMMLTDPDGNRLLFL